MIRIAICDDEKNIRAYLCTLVRKQDSESEITEYASADEYLSGGMEHDLLFLDIEMKGATSGMGQKEQRKNALKKAAIVFLAYVLVYLICDAVALPGWLRMIIVIVLLTASHRITGMEKNIAFLLGVLFFGIRDMCRLIAESRR